VRAEVVAVRAPLLMALGFALLSSAPGLGPFAASLVDDAAGWSTWVPPGEVQVMSPAAPLRVDAPIRVAQSTVPLFGGEVRVSDTDHIGEPSITWSDDGTLYVDAPGRFWKSTNDGASFTAIDMRAAGAVQCGCDADATADRQNNVFYTDLVFPVCTLLSISSDHGATWKSNNFCQATQDRQWVETNGLEHTYVTFRVGGDIYLNALDLSPRTDLLVENIGVINQFPSNFRAGALAIDRSLLDFGYFTYTSGNSVRVVITQLGGLIGGARGPISPLLANDRLVSPTGGSVNDAFSTATIDDQGNVYVVWNERVGSVTNTMVSVSKDHGQTWTASKKVNTIASTVFPWPIAGGDG
jgi:hypothetical protein